MTESLIRTDKAILDQKEKILELMKNKGMIAPFLTSSFINLFEPENTSHFRFKKTKIQLG